MKSDSVLAQLLDEDFSGVVFVRDYLQLQFNVPPVISVYTTCRIVVRGEAAAFGEPEFANLAIAQIGKDVSGVEETAEMITIEFEDSSRFEIPLHEEGLIGEACLMLGRDNSLHHW